MQDKSILLVIVIAVGLFLSKYLLDKTNEVEEAEKSGGMSPAQRKKLIKIGLLTAVLLAFYAGRVFFLKR